MSGWVTSNQLVTGVIAGPALVMLFEDKPQTLWSRHQTATKEETVRILMVAARHPVGRTGLETPAHGPGVGDAHANAAKRRTLPQTRCTPLQSWLIRSPDNLLFLVRCDSAKSRGVYRCVVIACCTRGRCDSATATERRVRPRRRLETASRDAADRCRGSSCRGDNSRLVDGTARKPSRRGSRRSGVHSNFDMPVWKGR